MPRRVQREVEEEGDVLFLPPVVRAMLGMQAKEERGSKRCEGDVRVRLDLESVQR